uniref:autotransporter-associated beta strand repeat-containing protein n=1 Tax=Candidatus Pelagibacter sp. HIMB1709 TaxID=3413367 RepID=UPI003F848268
TIGTLTGGGADGGNITLGAGALTIDQRSNGTYDGVISGTGSVTKTGVAALTLTRANTYSGGTTISRGQIKVGTNNALLNTGAVTMNGTGATDLVLPDGTSQTIGTLSGTNSNAMLNLLGSSSLTITQSSNANFAGNIRGDGSLVKNGSSDVTFTNAINKHTGLTTINAGSLVYANNSEIGAVTIANVAGATLDINGGTTTIRTLIGNDRSDIDFGTDGTLIVYQGSDQNYEGTLSGSGTISKRGSGKINRFGSTIVEGDSDIAAN